MSHTDKAGEAKALLPGQVDLDHVLDDIDFDRRSFTRQSKKEYALNSKQMEQNGLLPDLLVD